MENPAHWDNLTKTIAEFYEGDVHKLVDKLSELGLLMGLNKDLLKKDLQNMIDNQQVDICGWSIFMQIAQHIHNQVPD